jgi:hypothetical protein
VPAPDGQDQTPEELAADQAARERAERERAADSRDEHDVRVHERRAEKAEYLRGKLDDQRDADV